MLDPSFLREMCLLSLFFELFREGGRGLSLASALLCITPVASCHWGSSQPLHRVVVARFFNLSYFPLAPVPSLR